MVIIFNCLIYFYNDLLHFTLFSITEVGSAGDKSARDCFDGS